MYYCVYANQCWREDQQKKLSTPINGSRWGGAMIDTAAQSIGLGRRCPLNGSDHTLVPPW